MVVRASGTVAQRLSVLLAVEPLMVLTAVPVLAFTVEAVVLRAF